MEAFIPEVAAFALAETVELRRERDEARSKAFEEAAQIIEESIAWHLVKEPRSVKEMTEYMKPGIRQLLAAYAAHSAQSGEPPCHVCGELMRITERTCPNGHSTKAVPVESGELMGERACAGISLTNNPNPLHCDGCPSSAPQPAPLQPSPVQDFRSVIERVRKETLELLRHPEKYVTVERKGEAE